MEFITTKYLLIIFDDWHVIGPYGFVEKAMVIHRNL